MMLFLLFAGVDKNEVWYPAVAFFGGSQNPRNREDLGKNEGFQALKFEEDCFEEI